MSLRAMRLIRTLCGKPHRDGALADEANQSWRGHTFAFTANISIKIRPESTSIIRKFTGLEEVMSQVYRQTTDSHDNTSTT